MYPSSYEKNPIIGSKWRDQWDHGPQEPCVAERNSLELARKEITSHGIKPLAAFSFFSRIVHIDRDYLSFKRIFPGIALTGAVGQRNYN